MVASCLDCTWQRSVSCQVGKFCSAARRRGAIKSRTFLAGLSDRQWTASCSARHLQVGYIARRMNLYEVIRWGNDSGDVFTGGPNGHDTCFLFRGAPLDRAAQVADLELAKMPSETVQNWAGAIHLLGREQASEETPRILRGPYIQHAYTYGWRCWHRDTSDGPWVERRATDSASGRSSAK
mgnify:CR=1 FL=1